VQRLWVGMNRLLASLVLLASMSGCALHSGTKPQDPVAKQARLDTKLALFSANEAGGLPQGWEPLIVLRTKKKTQYQLVRKENATILHARAEGASSGLLHKVSIDPQKQPWLHWQWKIASLVKNADNTQRATEDSPVRIVLGFDGDKDSLPFTDQIMFETAKLVTGRDIPYATLMYIWENKAPVGTIIRSTHSDRVKMMVVERGAEGIGQWRDFVRNIVEDFEQAFGEKPGRLIGVGVLTDTDNTGETVEAWYGDIRLLRERSTYMAGEGAVQSLSVSQGQ
jgi:hypothetical protein